MHQIYEAAEGGHLDQAQQMITQVLADHPTSAKAHYVQAELYAKEGKTSLARAELGTAERLNPGLTSFNPRSVQELKSQLGLGTRSNGPQIVSMPARSGPHIPWGGIFIGLIVVGLADDAVSPPRALRAISGRWRPWGSRWTHGLRAGSGARVMVPHRWAAVWAPVSPAAWPRAWR